MNLERNFYKSQKKFNRSLSSSEVIAEDYSLKNSVLMFKDTSSPISDILSAQKKNLFEES
jgi:hypothetical protein